MAVAVEKTKQGAIPELPRATATDSGVRFKPPGTQSQFSEKAPDAETIMGKVVNLATRMKAKMRKSAHNLRRAFANMDDLDKDLPHVPAEAVLNEHCENGVMVIPASSLGKAPCAGKEEKESA